MIRTYKDVNQEHLAHIARGIRDNFKPLSFAQFSALRYKILDCR
jgi:hypothetical protein